jgi:hypothetical protein
MNQGVEGIEGGRSSLRETLPPAAEGSSQAPSVQRPHELCATFIRLLMPIRDQASCRRDSTFIREATLYLDPPNAIDIRGSHSRHIVRTGC